MRRSAPPSAWLSLRHGTGAASSTFSSSVRAVCAALAPAPSDGGGAQSSRKRRSPSAKVEATESSRPPPLGTRGLVHSAPQRSRLGFVRSGSEHSRSSATLAFFFLCSAKKPFSNSDAFLPSYGTCRDGDYVNRHQALVMVLGDGARIADVLAGA